MTSISMLFALLSFGEAAAPPDSLPFFGIQTHYGQSRPDLDTMMTLVRDAGIRAIRDEVYWHEVETSPGVFTFQPKHDAYIQAALSRGIQPLIILDYGNALYGGTPRDSGSRSAFARFCSTTVARYAPLGVKHYEIWNEPNLCIETFCPWFPAPSPLEYFELLKVAYSACKSADSSVIVLGGATSPLDEPETSEKIPGVDFIYRIFQLGAGACMDAVSFHQYPVNRYPEDWVPLETSRIRAVAPNKRLWITEVGHHTANAFGGVGEATQAAFIVRTWLVGRSISDLDRISWYDLQDDCFTDVDPECRYGILRQNKTPKDAYRAIAALHTTIGARSFVGLSLTNGIYTATFGSGLDVVRVVWTKSGSAIANVGVPTAYATVLSMYGDQRKILSAGGGDVSVTAGEHPQFVLSMPEGVHLNRLNVRPESCILDTLQTLQYEIFGQTEDSLTVPMSQGDVVWSYIGQGGEISAGGIFAGRSTGEGFIVASKDSLVDSAYVRIVAPVGMYVVEGFASNGWHLVSQRLDTSGTEIMFTDTVSGSSGTALALRYKYVYEQAYANTYIARLISEAPLMIPGTADSLKLYVKGDGQNHALVIQITDRDGDINPTIARRITWNTAWRFLAARINSGGTFDLPANVEEIVVYLIPAGTPVPGAVYSGTLVFDSLLAVFIPRTGTTVHDISPVPDHVFLFPNHPNPFNPSTTIDFSLPRSSTVFVRVYDILGREVAVLASGEHSSGMHRVTWDASRVASGLYVCRLDAPIGSMSRPMLLVR